MKNAKVKKIVCFCILFSIEISAIYVLGKRLIFTKRMEYCYNSSSMEMYSNRGEYTDEGCRIDEKSDYQGIFTYGPFVDLDKGSYKITVEYEATETGNTCTLSANSYYSFNALLCNDIPLTSTRNKVTFNAYLNENIRDCQLITYYNKSGTLLIRSVQISKTNDMARKNFVVMIIILLFTNLFIWNLKKGNFSRVTKEQSVVIGILMLGIILVSTPLFSLGLTRGSDLVFHLFRIEGLYDGLCSGNFPVRIQPTWMEEHGYAVSVFYGDAFIYIASILRLIGFSIQTSYKIFLFLINICTCIITYFLLKNLFVNAYVAAMGSVIYISAPFRLYSMYREGRLGEILAMIFIPMVVYGLIKIYNEDIKSSQYKKLYIIPTIGYIGLLNSHMLTTELMAGLTILVCILGIRKTVRWETFWELFKIVLLTMFISATYLIPFLHYFSKFDFNIQQESLWIQSGGCTLEQLLRLFPSTNENVINLNSIGYEAVESVGFNVIILIGIFIYVITYFKDKRKNLYRAMCVTFGIGIFTLFACTCYFPWDIIRKGLNLIKMSFLIDTLQRPTRLMPITLCLLVFCGVFALSSFGKCSIRKSFLQKQVIINGMLLFIITTSYYNNYLTDTKSQEIIVDVQKYVQHHTWSRDEYLSEGIKPELFTTNYTVSNENVNINDYQKEYLLAKMQVKNNSIYEEYVELPMVYYYGYSACGNDGEQLEVMSGENGVVRIVIPPNYDKSISVFFSEPVLWRLAEVISLISVVIWGLILHCEILHGQLC